MVDAEAILGLIGDLYRQGFKQNEIIEAQHQEILRLQGREDSSES